MVRILATWVFGAKQPILKNPSLKVKEAAFSQFPSPALREWAANSLSGGMKKTYFGPLVAQLDTKIQEQIYDKWNRDLSENHLMGYAVRTERYRLIARKDTKSLSKAPIQIELYDFKKDNSEKINFANLKTRKVKKLLAILNTEYKH